MKKIIGYVLAVIGLIGIFLSTNNGKKLVPLLANVKSTYILIISAIFVIAGVIFMVVLDKYGKQKKQEVPIYKGKEIVGYRREK